MWIQLERGSNVPISSLVLCCRVEAGLSHHPVDDAQRCVADTKRNQHAHDGLGAIERGRHRLAGSVGLRTFGPSVLSNLARYHAGISVLRNQETKPASDDLFRARVSVVSTGGLALKRLLLNNDTADQRGV